MQGVDLGAASSHLAAFSGAPVYAAGLEVVGALMHVLTHGPERTLDGLVIEAHVGAGGARYVDAPAVLGFYERGVTLALDREACAELPRPEPPAAGAHASGTDTLDGRLRRAWEVLAGAPGDAG